MTIKTALFGLGRTGKIVAQSLQEDERFELVFAVKNKVKKTTQFDFIVESKEQLIELIAKFTPDIVIDFTTPDAVIRNIKQLSEGTGYIIATTGFSKNQLQNLEKYKHLKILHAPNISDGINTVMKLCELLNQLWNNADVEIIEQHFKAKKDLPSRTAFELAKIFSVNTPIHSIRAGDIISIHEVISAKNNQKITIRHESFDKKVFAEGAKEAAIWLVDKPNGFYEVHDVYK